MKNSELPAFPISGVIIYTGLTKREKLAAMAMQGLLTRVPNREIYETDLGILESKRIADESVIMADTLLKALEENPNTQSNEQ